MVKTSYAKLNPVKFGLAWAIVIAVCTFLITLVALLNPGSCTYCTNFLADIYGFFGYSVSGLGLILGTIYVFIDIFIISWIFALLYNKFL